MIAAMGSRQPFIFSHYSMNDRSHTENVRKVRFPFWAYLNQPLFHPNQPFIANPSRFRRFYNIQELERCWLLSEFHLLEHCWRQKYNDDGR
ncbi:MAG: hypothetical protein HC780_26120 [Leptolyngbyaceae cyanobacterium CSU_1_3]|nr:hypothetical protein [Leptolyngbyaceae cyanobacterium CSU_1_3]